MVKRMQNEPGGWGEMFQDREQQKKARKQDAGRLGICTATLGLVVQEGGPLPGPETGLLSITWK